MSQLSTDQWKSVQLTRLKDSSVMQSHNIFKKGIQFSPPPTNYCTSHGELIFWTRILNNYDNRPFHWILSQNHVRFSKNFTLHHHSIIRSHNIQSMDNAPVLTQALPIKPVCYWEENISRDSFNRLYTLCSTSFILSSL